jgi:hypothetical protein
MVEERAQGRAFICFCTSPYLYRVILHFACSYIYTTLTLVSGNSYDRPPVLSI